MFFSKSQVTVIDFCTTFIFAAIDQLMVYGVPASFSDQMCLDSSVLLMSCL